MEITRVAKKTQGYGYKYTELADINKYCEENNINYYQEIETCELNMLDYIVTYVKRGDEKDYVRHRGCKITEAVLTSVKNPVQEYGSALTYSRRYSLMMALGIAGEDDDGQVFSQDKNKVLTTGAKKIGKKELDNLNKLLTPERIENMCNYYGIKSAEDLTISQYTDIVERLSKTK